MTTSVHGLLAKSLSFSSLVLLLQLSSAASSSTASSNSIAPLAVSIDDPSVSNFDIQRAVHVRDLLTRRLYHVESGKRKSDFSKWIKKQQGGAQVLSTHGRSIQTDMDDDAKQLLQASSKSLVVIRNDSRGRRNDDPFPQDRRNLDIPLVKLEENDDSSKTNLRIQRELTDRASIIISTHPTPNALQLSLRAIVLSLRFGPVLSTLGLAVMFPSFRKHYWYSWLTYCMAKCGPAWIKWGQWSSTRNDMFPDALCESLSRLHSDAPAHSWRISKETLEQSLQLAPNTLEQVFDEIETTPIASGSIAQVHRAVLSGELVALKIRHPKVEQLMELDFRLMGMAARVVDYLLVKLTGVENQIRESVKQFSHTMAAQSYLHVEAHHLEVLNDNFKNWPSVRFPSPFYASDAVIIETFEPGRIVTSMIDEYQRDANEIIVTTTMMQENESVVPVKRMSRAGPTQLQLIGGDDNGVDNTLESAVAAHEIAEDLTMADERANRTPAAHDLIPLDLAEFIVTTGLGLYLKMLLVDGLMHADLHPGNILIDVGRTKQRQHLYNEGLEVADAAATVDTTTRKRGSFLGISLVDAGMVAQLTEEESSNFIGLLASLGEGNGRDAANFALNFSQENALSEAEREAFRQDMDLLFQERCRGYHTNTDVGFVLRGVLDLIRQHRVRIGANYSTLVINALCIESLARNVCPSYHVLDAAKPLLRTYRKLCYSKDGTLKPNAPNSKRVKAWMGVMYHLKRFRDNRFFKKEVKQRTVKAVQ
ncbi:hypothetical protein MPSEU_000107700 [Mayamaea pseudoterrestris]|nr:hypothetical protein MPSEU_000107700 [Mayamaea pseudoterrestris]